MNPIFTAALEIQALCRAEGWRFCFIGAIAVQRWGEPRLTQDVDLELLTGFGGEERFVDRLLTSFAGRRADAREFALRHRVLLVENASAIPLDVSLGAMPFEERAVERSSPFEIGGESSLLTCSAEDLVVFKAFAGRDKDWLDIAGVAARQAGRLNESQVFRELAPLLELKGEPQAADRLRRLLDEGRKA